MGALVNIKCLDCGEEFKDTLGDIMKFKMYKCKQCGKTKAVPWSEKTEDPVNCDDCKIEMSNNDFSICPKCHSTNTKELGVVADVD